MKLKGLIDEDFLQYRLPSMFIITSTCDFKCEREAHCKGMCQNSELAKADTIEVNDKDIVYRYLNNDITKAIVFGGLEPFDQFEELFTLISLFRQYTNDIIILYTGYYKQEIEDKLESLKQFDNIIIKYGRYVPNSKSKYDDVLGITLASENQYAEKL